MATVLCGRRRERPRSEPWWPQPALKPARATSAPCSAQSVPEHRRSPTHPLGNYAEPAFRFYILYDKICREDVLGHAYALARANAGAPGVDGVTFDEIEAWGVEAWLAGLREDLVAKTYRPDAVRRVMIPKPGGGERPLGIPTIRDRVIQTAAKIVLEPVFEADFEDSAYGYRPRRSAIDAVKEVHRLL